MIPDMKIYEEALLNPVKNKFISRAKWHDYRSRSIYMVTIMKMPGIPDFCHLSGKIINGKAVASSPLSRLGFHLGYALRDLSSRFKELEVLQYIFMPDHVHILVFIKQPTSYHFSDVVRVFKQDCTKRYRNMLKTQYACDLDVKVFADGYNDRILTKENQLKSLVNYIRDNPRRLYLRKAFPQHFRSNILLKTMNGDYSLFGNLLLLEHPDKVQVRYSSKYTDEELNSKYRLWDETIRSGGVLVSPFYHPIEKDYLNRGMEDECKLIIICENGFPHRWKPEKRFMEACAEGRLLFVGPAEFDSRKQVLTRQMCIKRNEDAKFITELTKSDYTLSRRK